VFIFALAILVIVSTRWTRWEGNAEWQSTDDAYLQADLTPIAAKVAGYVRALPVQDFDRVRAGDVLAQIVDDDYRAAVAQLEASVASAAAQVQALKAQRELQEANVLAAKAAIDATVANAEQNTRDVARQERLLKTGSSSTESAEINLGYTRIVAPQDGVIGQRQIKPGQYVGVGGQVTTLTPLPHVWVIANYKETQLTHMAVGEPADISVDTFPGHRLRGHVLAFAPGAGSQFALLPPDNATGNFTKVVQRIAVKISIEDADGLLDRLRPGMSVVARVDTRSRDRR
jgi:membrane fusion protein (multidrug efflux system)